MSSAALVFIVAVYCQWVDSQGSASSNSQLATRDDEFKTSNNSAPLRDAIAWFSALVVHGSKECMERSMVGFKGAT